MLGRQYRLASQFRAVIGIEQGDGCFFTCRLILLVEVEAVVLNRSLCGCSSLPAPKRIHSLEVAFGVLWVEVVERAGELVTGRCAAVQCIVEIVKRGLVGDNYIVRHTHCGHERHRGLPGGVQYVLFVILRYHGADIAQLAEVVAERLQPLHVGVVCHEVVEVEVAVLRIERDCLVLT